SHSLPRFHQVDLHGADTVFVVRTTTRLKPSLQFRLIGVQRRNREAPRPASTSATHHASSSTVQRHTGSILPGGLRKTSLLWIGWHAGAIYFAVIPHPCRGGLNIEFDNVARTSIPDFAFGELCLGCFQIFHQVFSAILNYETALNRPFEFLHHL